MAYIIGNPPNIITNEFTRGLTLLKELDRTTGLSPEVKVELSGFRDDLSSVLLDPSLHDERFPEDGRQWKDHVEVDKIMEEHGPRASGELEVEILTAIAEMRSFLSHHAIWFKPPIPHRSTPEITIMEWDYEIDRQRLISLRDHLSRVGF